MKITSIGTVLLCCSVALLLGGCPVPRPSPPVRQVDHVVVMVFDQMRPDYIDQYDLREFKRLRERSVEYTNAHVGHIPSITLISHPVISYGVPPRELPWHDNLFRDTNEIFRGGKQLFDLHRFGVEEFQKLHAHVPVRSLPGSLKASLGGTAIAVGGKLYAAMTFGTNDADSIVTLKKESGRCVPAGVNVPAYIESNDRFTLECSNRYGTEGSLYPIDGARLSPGTDSSHLGGDIWVSDVAKEVMKHEKWSVLLLTFGGIDRHGHLWGDMDIKRSHPFSSEFTFEKALKTADEQLGVVLREIERQDLTSRTAIVVTADHGAQSNRYYLGNGKGGTFGSTANGNSEGPEPPFWINRLSRFGAIEAVEADSAIRIWTPHDSTSDQLRDAIGEISGVYTIFEKRNTPSGVRYERVYLQTDWVNVSPWGIEHDEELVKTAAGPGGATYIALLEDGVGFDLLGEHGGAQELVQRIPLFILIPTVAAHKDSSEVKLSDVKGIVLERCRLGPTQD